MKYYIATTLTNAHQAQRLRDRLDREGHRFTYDWTVHGAAAHLGPEGLGEIALREFHGVLTADVVFILLPGGKGTHTELGMAAAYGKPIIIWDETRSQFLCDEATCSFYWMPGIRARLAGRLTDTALERLVNEADAAVLDERIKRGAYHAR